MAENAVARKEAKEQRKEARATAGHAGLVARRTHCILVFKRGNKNQCPSGEEGSEVNEEAVNWQEVVNTRDKQKLKKAAHVSLLSVANNQSSSPKIRAKLDSGTAEHVKLERKTAPNKFVAANGEQITDWRDKTIPVKTHRRFTDA